VTDANCLFCKIVARTIPADIVHETDGILAFRDIGPQAPTHVLVIPKEHISSLEDATDDQGALLGELMLVARDVARAEGVSETGFRAVVNTASDGGQTVAHLHLHVLGGRAMRWPPG